MVKVFIVVCILVLSISNAIFALGFGGIFDAINDRNMDMFWVAIAAMLIPTVIEYLATTGYFHFLYKDVGNSCKKLSVKVYKKQLEYDRAQDIDMDSFTTKINNIYDSYYTNKWYIVLNAIQVITAVVTMLYVSWMLLLVVIVTSLIPMLIPGLCKKVLQKASKEYSDQSTTYVQSVEDMLKGRLEIAKHGVGDKFIDKHHSNNKVLGKKWINTQVINYSTNQLAFLVGVFCFGALIFAGGILTFQGAIALGALVTTIQLMNSVVFPVISIVSYINTIKSCQPVLDQLNEEVLPRETVSTILNKEANDILEMKNVSFRYEDGQQDVLTNFSRTFSKGNKYLIQGESGSGKTTIAKLLSGELQPDDGEVMLYNESVCHLDNEQLLKAISYVDQRSYVFKDTLYNNISFYRDFSQDRIGELLQILKLDNLDLNKEINDDVGLSGGQKSRVCLSRALMDIPDVLILDEPTAALDQDSARVVINYLCSLPSTIIVISHENDMEITNKFDEVICVA